MIEMFVFGCTVDYVKELGGSYLKVINPNVKHHVDVVKVFCSIGENNDNRNKFWYKSRPRENEKLVL